MISQILRTSTEVILSRFEKNRENYPFIDTKFHVVSGRDYDESDEPFRRKDCIYSWIQSRGLESLAKHILFFQASGEIKTAERLKDMLSVVTETMERLRAINHGRLPFAMHPDGSPFFERESDHANFSDLFYSKGLFTASRILGRPDLETESERLFSFVLNEIERGVFHTDQQCFDPKNKVSFVPGKNPQGPRMIALGGIADRIAAKPDEKRWEDSAEAFIRYIFEHHINRGQYEACRRWDFIESVDSDGKPWYDGNVLFCDPGHALEFVGLAAKCLLILRKLGKKNDLLEDARDILPNVFIHVFDYGFNSNAGGICKGFDLTERKVINGDMPWWSLPETVRAGIETAKLFPSDRADEILFRIGQAFQAFVQGFLQPNGFGCQTRSEAGEIIDVIPAVPDADPGYHTNLSLLDVLIRSSKLAAC